KDGRVTARATRRPRIRDPRIPATPAWRAHARPSHRDRPRARRSAGRLLRPGRRLEPRGRARPPGVRRAVHVVPLERSGAERTDRPRGEGIVPGADRGPRGPGRLPARLHAQTAKRGHAAYAPSRRECGGPGGVPAIATFTGAGRRVG